MKRYIIWLDEERDPTAEPWRAKLAASYYNAHNAVTTDVVWCRTYDEFVEAFMQRYEENTLVAVWFNHDVGRETLGRQAFSWMENYIREVHDCEEFYMVFDLHCCAANPVVQEKMDQNFDRLWLLWEEWRTT